MRAYCGRMQTLLPASRLCRTTHVRHAHCWHHVTLILQDSATFTVVVVAYPRSANVRQNWQRRPCSRQRLFWVQVLDLVRQLRGRLTRLKGLVDQAAHANVEAAHHAQDGPAHEVPGDEHDQNQHERGAGPAAALAAAVEGAALNGRHCVANAGRPRPPEQAAALNIIDQAKALADQRQGNAAARRHADHDAEADKGPVGRQGVSAGRAADAQPADRVAGEEQRQDAHGNNHAAAEVVAEAPLLPRQNAFAAEPHRRGQVEADAAPVQPHSGALAHAEVDIGRFLKPAPAVPPAAPPLDYTAALVAPLQGRQLAVLWELPPEDQPAAQPAIQPTTPGHYLSAQPPAPAAAEPAAAPQPLHVAAPAGLPAAQPTAVVAPGPAVAPAVPFAAPGHEQAADPADWAAVVPAAQLAIPPAVLDQEPPAPFAVPEQEVEAPWGPPPAAALPAPALAAEPALELALAPAGAIAALLHVAAENRPGLNAVPAVPHADAVGDAARPAAAAAAPVGAADNLAAQIGLFAGNDAAEAAAINEPDAADADGAAAQARQADGAPAEEGGENANDEQRAQGNDGLGDTSYNGDHIDLQAVQLNVGYRLPAKLLEQRQDNEHGMCVAFLACSCWACYVACTKV